MVTFIPHFCFSILCLTSGMTPLIKHLFEKLLCLRNCLCKRSTTEDKLLETCSIMGRFPPAPLLLAPLAPTGSMSRWWRWEQLSQWVCSRSVPLTPAFSVKVFSKFRRSSGVSTHGCICMVHCTQISTEARQKESMGFGDDGIHQWSYGLGTEVTNFMFIRHYLNSSLRSLRWCRACRQFHQAPSLFPKMFRILYIHSDCHFRCKTVSCLAHSCYVLEG